MLESYVKGRMANVARGSAKRSHHAKTARAGGPALTGDFPTFAL